MTTIKVKILQTLFLLLVRMTTNTNVHRNVRRHYWFHFAASHTRKRF